MQNFADDPFGPPVAEPVAVPAGSIRSTVIVDRVRDYGVSLLRTGVPIAWGYVLTWLVGLIPALQPMLERPEVIGLSNAITFALALGWYAVMRWVEPRLPAWLTRIVLGANAAPTYVEGTATAVVRETPNPR